MSFRDFAAIICTLLPIAAVAQPLPGGLDTNFVAETYSSQVFWSLAVQANGKIIAAGRDGASYGFITRLNTNGTADGTFLSGSRGTCADSTIPQINSVSLQNNGSMIAGGAFTYFDAPTHLRLARLKGSGALDDTFTAGANAAVNATLVQPDGKILIAGSFLNFKSSGKNYIARMNSEGTVDAQFNLEGSGPNAKVLSMALTQEGKIVIGGDFTTVNGQSRAHVARLLSDGSVDTTFDPGVGADDTVEGVAVQSDDKVLIGGWFYNVANTPRNRIARLTSTGSLDMTFDPGSGANSRVYAFAFQGEKILAAGRFTQYNGTNRSKIVRLLSNGSIDSTFDPMAGSGTLSTDEIRAIQIQRDGNILIAGKFTVFSGQPRNGLARLYADSITNQVTQPMILLRTGSQGVRIDWDGTCILQNSTNVNGPYADIPGATNPPIPIPDRAKAEFFRLRTY